MSPIAGVILLLNLAAVLFFIISSGWNESGEKAESTAFLTILILAVIGSVDVISIIVCAIRAIFKV